MYPLTKQTETNASGNGNRNPDKILRNIEPGMAKDCRLRDGKLPLIRNWKIIISSI